MENTERDEMSRNKTDNSMTVPEHSEDITGRSLESTSSSTDAEPSTSNKVSFKEDAAERVQGDRPESDHETDLVCVGSGFSRPLGEGCRPPHPKPEKRSLHRSASASPSKQTKLGESAHELIRVENMEDGKRSSSEAIIRDPETDDDESFGHAADIEDAEVKVPDNGTA